MLLSNPIRQNIDDVLCTIMVKMASDTNGCWAHGAWWGDDDELHTKDMLKVLMQQIPEWRLSMSQVKHTNQLGYHAPIYTFNATFLWHTQ